MKNQEKTARKNNKLNISRILILLLIVIVLVLAFLRFNLRRKLLARLDTVRADGYPVTFEELNEWYSIPMNMENAAFFVMEAQNYYNEPTDEKLLPVLGNAELPGRTEVIDDKTKETISQFLSENQKCLELLHKTAGLEYGRYPVDLNMGIATSAPYLSYIRLLAQLLQLEAINESEEGKQEEAFKSIKSIWSIANSLNNEPLIVSQFVRIAWQNIAISSIEYAINRTDFSDEQLKDLNESLVKAEQNHGMLNSVIGERCMSLDILIHPKCSTWILCPVLYYLFLQSFFFIAQLD